MKSALGVWPFGAGTGGVPGSNGQSLDEIHGITN